MKNLTEFEKCKKQFITGNKVSFLLIVFFQFMLVLVNISLAYAMLLLVGAMEEMDVSQLWKAVLVVVLMMIGFAVFGTLFRIVKNHYIKKGLLQFKGYVFEKILSKSIGEYSGTLSGNFLSVFSNDLNVIETNYLNGTVNIIGEIIMFVLAIVAMGFLNPIIMITIFVACIIPLLVSTVYGSRLVKKEKETSDENAGFISQTKDLLNGFFVIKSFKAEAEVLNLFGKQDIILEEAKRNKRETTDSVAIASEISEICVMFLVFGLSIYFVFLGTMNIATVIASIQLSNYVLRPIRTLVPLASARKASLSLIEKIANGLEETTDQSQGKIQIATIESGIYLDQVTLKFDQNNTVLDHVSIDFLKGKSYAIVGASGCGKSTLVQTIMGYYDDYSGQISIDSYDLKTIEIDSLYDVVSMIQQTVFLFDKTIKNNITMFKDFDEDKMQRAITRAGLLDIIEEKGAHYNCGESGCKLSGGEKQRVSIARCLIRETPVLIMDEATAALDHVTAYQVENEILEMDHLTRIIVTHKLEENLLKKYDEIIVMRDGKIVEQGNYQKLIEQKEYFYSLYHVSKVESIK